MIIYTQYPVSILVVSTWSHVISGPFLHHLDGTSSVHRFVRSMTEVEHIKALLPVSRTTCDDHRGGAVILWEVATGMEEESNNMMFFTSATFDQSMKSKN